MGKGSKRPGKLREVSKEELMFSGLKSAKVALVLSGLGLFLVVFGVVLSKNAFACLPSIPEIGYHNPCYSPEQRRVYDVLNQIWPLVLAASAGVTLYPLVLFIRRGYLVGIIQVLLLLLGLKYSSTEYFAVFALVFAFVSFFSFVYYRSEFSRRTKLLSFMAWSFCGVYVLGYLLLTTGFFY